MKKSYETPQAEVIEIELENILCASPDVLFSDYIDGDDAA